MGATVGIRELRDRASAMMARVRAGETITVTDRDEPIAIIVPLHAPQAARLRALEAAGVVVGRGDAPLGLPDGPVIRGPTVALAVIEDRR